MKSVQFRSGCPVSSLLDLIGDKWTMLVIRDIALFDKHTFNEFLQSEEAIATNILSDRLNKLCDERILERGRHNESKAKIYYKLTKRGIDLVPLLLEMAIWSDRHLPIDKKAKAFVKSVKENKPEVLKKIQAKLSALHQALK